MWEQIRSNKRKSAILVVVMAFLLVALGFTIGFAAVGREEGALLGVGVAVLLWIILCLTAFAGGNSIMLATAGARRIEKADMPRLFNVVEEMTIAAGLPKMPEVYLMESDVPNAFAVGTPQRAAVAVTTGLLSRLNRDELQSVIAHEIGHITNLDCRFMVLIGVMVGAIVIIADIFLRSMRYGGLGRSRSSKGGGQLQAILFIVAILLAILAPIVARLLYFACSRRREFLADACSARFTRYPEGLASALEKIDGAVRHGMSVNRVVAPMMIVNPLQAPGVSGLLSTHPATSERVQVLRSMAGGASYAQYEQAYRQITKGGSVVGASALTDQAAVEIRPPSADLEPAMATRRREAMDTLHKLNGFRIAQCACGTRMKIPPVYQESQIECPSCGKTVEIPPAAGADPPTPTEPLKVHLQEGSGWKEIQCSCGKTISISPGFGGRHMHCSKCGRQIEFE